MKDRNLRSFAKTFAAIGALLALTLSASNAWATEYTAARKAGRGFAAVTTAFLEVPGNIVAEMLEPAANPRVAPDRILRCHTHHS